MLKYNLGTVFDHMSRTISQHSWYTCMSLFSEKQMLSPRTNSHAITTRFPVDVKN